MSLLGTENMSAYLRKIAIDGYLVKLEMNGLSELTSQMKQIANSENQIAKRRNATGSIDKTNIEEIQKVRKYAELTELTPYAAHEL